MTEEQFKKYVDDNIRDYILLTADNLAGKAHNPDFKAKAIDKLSELVTKFENKSMHELYIEQLRRHNQNQRKHGPTKIKAILKERGR